MIKNTIIESPEKTPLPDPIVQWWLANGERGRVILMANNPNGPARKVMAIDSHGKAYLNRDKAGIVHGLETDEHGQISLSQYNIPKDPIRYPKSER